MITHKRSTSRVNAICIYSEQAVCGFNYIVCK